MPDHIEERRKELSQLTDEYLFMGIDSSQRAIASCGDSENGDDYALATLFNGRDLALDELARRKGVPRDQAYSLYNAWLANRTAQT